jgi:hypothetical protein
MPTTIPAYQEIIQANELTSEEGDPRSIEGKIMIEGFKTIDS